MSIKVQIKNNYGNQVIYPVCDKSKVFARMLGQKTLTLQNLDYIKSLGFTIEVAQAIAVGF